MMKEIIYEFHIRLSFILYLIFDLRYFFFVCHTNTGRDIEKVRPTNSGLILCVAMDRQPVHRSQTVLLYRARIM